MDEVVSLKTFKPASNTTLSNFKSTLRSYAKKLSEVTIDATHNSKQRVLDFVIEKNVWDKEFDTILEYIDDLTDVNIGEFKNVEVRITEF